MTPESLTIVNEAGREMAILRAYLTPKAIQKNLGINLDIKSLKLNNLLIYIKLVVYLYCNLKI
ncbi:hypothetical protein A9Q90_09025 [Gammaproteobacteria bacterium 54_18_T64]|nr:hypothetical protein A9Q90_09025 [Gammaproteobacteria bacterium 54_18_T64]